MLNLPKIISIDRKHAFWSLAAGHWGRCLTLGVHCDEPSSKETGREEYSFVGGTEGKEVDLLIWMIGQTVASRGSFWVQTFIRTGPERPETPVLFHTFLWATWLDLSKQLRMKRKFRDWKTDRRGHDYKGAVIFLGRAVILYYLVACKGNSN